VQAGLNTRLKIHQILKELKTSSLSFDEVFERRINNKKYSLRDKKLIYTVVLNSMRNYIYIDKIINKFSKKNKKINDSYFLLLSAITQLLILNFKEFAVVHSTVELAKKNQLNSSPNYINGILRNIIRNKKKLILNLYNIEFSNLPNWFTEKIKLSEKNKKFLMKTIRAEPDLHLVFKEKINFNVTNDNYIKTSDYSLSIKKKFLIENIKGYNHGIWWVQDFSAMLPIYLLDNIKNKDIIDFCSAPGGKTFQLINKGGNVVSIDKNKQRFNILKKNLNRLNLKCKTLMIDVLDINFENKFDLIVLDAPCSSIGTIRRNPEIFFRNKNPNFKKINLIQKKLLNKAKTLLNNNGIILYMVCSFFDEEGKNIVKDFLNENKNYKLGVFSSKKMANIQSYFNKDGFLYVLPNQRPDSTLIDGFFAAIIKKND
tara:strand:- start:2637 stop:3920 length:1284 start_codon:yes stop_codon:yes gene_type:complete